MGKTNFTELSRVTQEALASMVADISEKMGDAIGSDLEVVVLVHQKLDGEEDKHNALVLSSSPVELVHSILAFGMFTLEMQLQQMYEPPPPGTKLN